MRLDLSLPSYMARATVGRLGTGQGYCDTETLNTETLNTETLNTETLNTET